MKNMTNLSEKEQEMQKKLIGFDKAKELHANISAILDVEDWGWILTDKYTHKPDTLTLTFKLKESAVEVELKKLDKAQDTLDKHLEQKAKPIPD